MRVLYIVLTLCLLIVMTTTVFGQAMGDYRSAGSGNWNVAATWQQWNGTAWANAAAAPTGSGVITIQSTDSVMVNVAVTITGTLKNQGKVEGDSNLTIGNGGTFQHDQNAGRLPSATWATGSTLLITSITATAPSNSNQNFYNVSFNTPGLTGNLNMAWNNITIGGNIRVIATGSTNRWQMTAAASGDSAKITVMGDIIVEGGSFSSNGTSNSNSHHIIHQYGNVVVTGGNFSVSRGSQGSGSGSTRWYLHGDSFSMTGATTQNSNATNAWFIFAKQGTQTLTLGAGNTLTALPIVVGGGTTLDMGSNKLRGSGRFTLEANATLAIAEPGGIDSAVSVTGTVSMSKAGNFTFKGTAAQVTGTSLPDTVKNVTIDNAAGVTLSRSTVINGVLTLKSGLFDNTIPFTLGAGGSISIQGGSLKNPVVSGVEPIAGAIPESFIVEQNYPNPFNPSTTIVFGLPQESRVKLEVFDFLGRHIATLVDEQKQAGRYSVDFNANGLSSGTYLYKLSTQDRVLSKAMMLLK